MNNKVCDDCKDKLKKDYCRPCTRSYNKATYKLRNHGDESEHKLMNLMTSMKW